MADGLPKSAVQLQKDAQATTEFTGRQSEESKQRVIDKEVADRAEARRASVEDFVGGDPDNPEPFREARVEALDFVARQADNVSRGFMSGSFAGSVASAYKYGEDPWDFLGMEDKDPNYNPENHIDELLKGVPVDNWEDVLDEGNLQSGLIARDRLVADLADQRVLSQEGTSGVIAGMAGMMLDVDLPLTFLSSGAYTQAKLARAALRSKAGNIGVGALKGGVALGALETANVFSRDSLDWTSIPMAAFIGSGIGGYVGKKAGQRASQEAMVESVRRAEKAFTEGVASDSVGAQRQPDYPAMDYDVIPEQSEELIRGYGRTWRDRTGYTNAKHAAWDHAPESIKKTHERMGKFLDEHPTVAKFVRSDYERIASSRSSVAQRLANDLLESPTGEVRNNVTAAMLDHTYQNKILGKAILPYQRTYDRWARAKGAGVVDRHFHDTLQREFGVEVNLEMNHRRINNGASRGGVDPLVKQAADDIQEAADEALGIQQGRNGERAVDGMQDVNKVGYSPIHWTGASFRKALDNGASRADIEELFLKGYRGVFAGVIDDADLRVFSKAMVSRQLAKSDGIDESLTNLLSSDGRARITSILRDSGVKNKDIDRIMGALEGNVTERGKVGHAKKRLEIDLSAEHNGLKLVDFLDTNMVSTWSRYARNAAGRAALARKGITNNTVKENIIKAILDEQNAIASASGTVRKAQGLGASTTERTADITRADLDHLFTYFRAGPVGEGLSDGVRRAKQFTNLVLLNQLGLVQVAETGAIVAASGFENFVASSPFLSRAMRRGSINQNILEELAPFTGRIGDEHLLIRDDLALDMMRSSTVVQSEFLQGVDKYLGKGQRLQGWVSGFYQVRAMQQRMAVMSMANKVAKMVRDGTAQVGDRRLTDIGLSGRQWTRIQADMRNHVTFTPEGNIDRLNMDQWSYVNQNDFALAMNRHTNQVVQRAMAGESMAWMHKDVGALFSHLRQFPILAGNKQTMRNLRIMDQASIHTLTYGLMTSGMAYWAKQVINGRDDNLTLQKIGVGALSYSNMTGIFPMMADPIASMLGMNDLRFNRYGPSTNLLGAPAIDVINKATKAGGEILEGDLANAMKVTPIIGNLYGFSALWNAAD